MEEGHHARRSDRFGEWLLVMVEDGDRHEDEHYDRVMREEEEEETEEEEEIMNEEVEVLLWLFLP